MTPSGRCPDSTCPGFLAPLHENSSWARCYVCNASFDRHGNAYDVQGRLTSGRGS